MDAWTASDRPIATIPVVKVADLDRTIIDVRQANEYRNGHIPVARNVELAAITTAPIATDEPATLMCGHGERAMTAASLLARRGIHVRVFDGGPDTWATATGQALEAGR
jgi:rhodanese-related sulfurtransferase